MNMIVYKLMHFSALGPADRPNVARHRGKGIGIFTSETRALEGLKRVVEKPGFRDWPDGFRLFSIDLDRDYWTAGFIAGPDGDDVAIEGDPSPLVGNDSGLAGWSDDDTRDADAEEQYLRDLPDHLRASLIWELFHCKISEHNPQAFDDMGYKMIGYYGSRNAADRAIARLRSKPGFRDSPGGFRIATTPPDETGWTEGFVAGDEAD